MAHGHFEGKNAADPQIRSLFDREKVREQSWYHDRIKSKQMRDVSYLENQAAYMKAFLEKGTHREESGRLGLGKRLSKLEDELVFARSSDFLSALAGTIGLDCSLKE